MIYLDNAATTWPKPLSVRTAVADALLRFGANPGRGGHRMAMETAQQVYACREAAAEFFGMEDPGRVVFTTNCTAALNLVIKGLLLQGGHAVVSDMEHNSVLRPLTALKERGVSYSVASVCEGDTHQTVENFKRCIRPDTRLVLCTHASNVFGTVLPIREIGKLAHRMGVLFAVDAAQSAGVLPINMERDHIDFLCVPGHKGLYGPMGTGMLLCRSSEPLYTVWEGGTGNRSLELVQPDELPERLESGTLNVPGICGLHAGLRWVARQGVRTLEQHENTLLHYFVSLSKNTPSLKFYADMLHEKERAPLLSINLNGKTSEETARMLAMEDVAVRAGLHCAPAAHAHGNTLPDGTVRIAPGAFTSQKDMEALHKILIKISRKP